MKVIVNGEATDQFGRPSDEQEVGEFIEEINNELGKSNRVLSDVRIDGDVLAEEHRSIKCREVDEIEVAVSTLEDLTISSIGELGTYAHRFLDRIPDIVQDWQDIGREQVETYREQVLEALEATSKVLTSIDKLTNLDAEETDRGTMIDRAEELRDNLGEADPDQVKALIKDSAKDYFQDLIDTLQSVLDQFKERRKAFVEKIEDIREVLRDLQAEVDEIVEEAQRRSSEITEWFNFERVRSMTEDLTKVNTILNELDQAGKLRSYFPSEQHEQIEKTLTELREGIGRLFGLLEDQDPTEIVKVLRKEIQPYLEKAVLMFEELTVEESGSGEGESKEEPIDV